jgi:hypothetical protein
VRGTEDWLEEALAQAVLVESTMLKKALGVTKPFIEEHLKPYLRTFPPGYRDFDKPGGMSATVAHQKLAADVLDYAPGVTSLFTPYMEYTTGFSRVPVYLVFSSAFASKFQLATPTLQRTLKYFRQRGYPVDEEAKGDHKRVFVNGRSVQLNRSRSRKEVDLASIKDIAKCEGITTHELIRRILNC